MMKRIITALIIVGLSATVANADWLANFTDNYKNNSLDTAVEKALEEGVAPDDIVKNCLKIQTVNPQNMVKALYCAGVSGEDVYNAAQNNNVSELIVTAGFKKSKEECSGKVADTQAYTPSGPTQTTTFGGATGGQSSKLNVSPSTP